MSPARTIPVSYTHLDVYKRQELANLSGRFNYEFICDINKRVPREYLRDGKVVEQVDYF